MINPVYEDQNTVGEYDLCCQNAYLKYPESVDIIQAGPEKFCCFFVFFSNEKNTAALTLSTDN